MRHWRYYYHGLNIISALPLPELNAFEMNQPVCAPDVSISLGGEAFEFAADENFKDEYRFFIKEVGWYVVRGGRHIFVHPLKVASMRQLRIFLLGSAWGALLYQRQMVLIHGSAVQVDGAAVIFCAQRGEGKSTLAALLDAQGHNLISDDLCCLKLSGGETPMVYPSVPRMRLWSDAIRELGWDTSGCEPDHLRAGKFQYLRTTAITVNPLPIREIYVLGWGEARVQRLTGFVALRRFIDAARWRGDLLVKVGNPVNHLQRCADLLQLIPLSEFRRPRNLAESAEQVRYLASLWENRRANNLT
jgi:hypothetical protein